MSTEIERLLSEALADLSDEMSAQTQQIAALWAALERDERAPLGERLQQAWDLCVAECKAEWGHHSEGPDSPNNSPAPELTQPLCVECAHAGIVKFGVDNSGWSVYCAQTHTLLSIPEAPIRACSMHSCINGKNTDQGSPE